MVRLILIAVVMASAVVVALGAPVPDVKPQVKPNKGNYSACMDAVKSGRTVVLSHGNYSECEFSTDPSDSDWAKKPAGVYLCYMADGVPTMKQVLPDAAPIPTATRQPVFPAIQQLFPRLAPTSSCGPGGCPQPQYVPGFRYR